MIDFKERAEVVAVGYRLMREEELVTAIEQALRDVAVEMLELARMELNSTIGRDQRNVLDRTIDNLAERVREGK